LKLRNQEVDWRQKGVGVFRKRASLSIFRELEEEKKTKKIFFVEIFLEF